MYKAFVDKIHQEKAKNDSNSRDLARTLNVLSKTVFGEVNRFVFELLQNADDSSANSETVNVQFQLLDNYLIFSHNGKHFTDDDVEGISGIGNRVSKKDKNNEKTGYKGIGFKSVFGSSDYAHILSGGFSFRFDKNYDGFDGSEDYPWQVVPIWTNEPADEVNGKYSLEHVNTIIKVDNREIIRKEIIDVFDDCQIILFLRNVEKVTFIDRNNKVFEVSKKIKAGVVDLYNNDELESSWLLKNMELPINDELSKKLNQLSETECPQKLKEAKATKLTFAAMIEGQHLTPIKRTVIYSYLPTKAQKGFPFLINGDFLTNAERTELMPNIWNEFLFTEIAQRQLEWFRDLQETVYRYDVLKLLNGKYPSYSTSNIDLAYNKSLDNAALTVDFLPEQGNDDYMITIGNSIIDGPKFSEMFSPSIISDFLGVSETYGVVDVLLESQSALSELGAMQFTFINLLNLIASGKITDVNGATNVIVFFYNRTINNKNPSWIAQLQQAAFVMDESGIYKTPKEIFIPAHDGTLDTEFGDLSYVHTDILTHFKGNTDVLSWLQNLGIREPTDVEIVRKALIPIILNDGINESNALTITRFITKVYQAKMLNDQDYEDLKHLKLITSNGLKLPPQCYLSDTYNPEKNCQPFCPMLTFYRRVT